ncbi:hypothetical protein GCM10027290_44860 [Micromonospora sonneratiae]|uniref:Flavin reductase n=1 Tax=Micromonospora sonneratiae TaxID=1184706 RepID=A0ABW3Y8N1_9ACTN
MTRAPHRAIQPFWLCRVCAAPWPCGDGRLELLREYADDRIGLSFHLATLYVQAATDLHQIHPYEGPDPGVLFQRFLGWLPRVPRPPG